MGRVTPKMPAEPSGSAVRGRSERVRLAGPYVSKSTSYKGEPSGQRSSHPHLSQPSTKRLQAGRLHG